MDFSPPALTSVLSVYNLWGSKVVKLVYTCVTETFLSMQLKITKALRLQLASMPLLGSVRIDATWKLLHLYAVSVADMT